MLSYWLKCRKNTKSKKSKLAKNKSGIIMFATNCVVCGGKINLDLLKSKKEKDC